MKAIQSILVSTLFLCLINHSVVAQIENDRWSITGELCLPSGRANEPFRNYLNGLVSAQPKLTYKPLENWYVAVAPRYQYYTISEFKVPVKMNGGMHAFGGNLEFGWTKWQTERFGIEIGLKTGISQHVFVTDLTRVSGIQRLTAIYTEPTISFILASDEAVAYRWIVGYNISGYDFKPYHVGLETNGGYDNEDIDKPSQTLLVGFGLTYYFKNKRSDVFIDE